MSESLTEFLFRAYREGVECTLEELRTFDEFGQPGLMQSLAAISSRLARDGLCLHPPIEEGELGDRRVVARAESPESFRAALLAALESDESFNVEFKESLYLKKKIFGREDIERKNWVGEEIIFEAISTICSFLNAEGGTLVIGAKDGGEIVGIDCEAEFIPGGRAGDFDKWELFFSNCLKKYIYDWTNCISYVQRKILQHNGLHVCVVIVRKRQHSLSVCRACTDANSELVFVRNGNGKAEIKARAIEELIKLRLAK